MIEFKVTGFTELKKFLDTFPEKVQQECERKAAAAGASIVWNAARANFDRYNFVSVTGLTRKNIRMKKLTGRNKWEVHYGVGISRYGMFLELGTRRHTIAAKRKKILAKVYTTMGRPMGKKAAKVAGTFKGDRPIWTEIGEVFGKKVEVSSIARPFLRPAFYNNINAVINAERAALASFIANQSWKRTVGYMKALSRTF